MCGRYAVFTEEENEELREIINDLNERYKEDAGNTDFKTGEIYPSDNAPVIIADNYGNRSTNILKWGFPNFRQQKGIIINARSETADQKPSFSKLLGSGRCLIPASGFFEWKQSPEGKKSKKDKYLIRADGQNLVYMAGLYNTFRSPDGRPTKNFVVLTTDASMPMSHIHNRMPVILNKEAQQIWLKNDIDNNSELKRVMVPYTGLLNISLY